MTLDLDDLALSVHRNSVEHGFWDGVEKDLRQYEPTNEQLVERLALIVCEVTEAVEALRDNTPDAVRSTDGGLTAYDPRDVDPVHDHCGKPIGLASELADVLIRTLDLMKGLGYDISEVVKLKAAYNATRPYKHGKEF